MAPEHMTTTKNMVLPPRDFLFTAAFRQRRGLRALPACLHETETDYVMWAFVGHRLTFSDDPGDLGQFLLRQLIEDRVTGWHPTLRRLIADTDPATVQAFDFSASESPGPWPTTNVTLLGDALHYMPPVGGLGGNAALHDASLLCSALQAAACGEMSLEEALQEYEADMRQHGFEAVRESLFYTRLAISQSRPLRSIARTFFRVCGRVPSLRRAIF